MTLEEFRKLQSDLENLKREEAIAEGQLKQIRKQLRGHGCKTIEDAKDKIAAMEKQAAKAEREFDEAKRKFAGIYGDKL